MENKIIIISVVLVILITISVILFLPNNTTTQNKNNTNTYSPQTFITPLKMENAKIISTSPLGKNISLDSKITIAFNQNILEDQFYFAIAPNIKYTISKQGNTFIITPLQSLMPNIGYSYFAGIKNQVKYDNFNFATIIDTTKPIPDTFGERNYLYNRSVHPDGFLYNLSPYKTTNFYISGIKLITPTEHFSFSVTLLGKDKNKSKQSFLDWLKSLGLNQAQITTLEVIYSIQ